MVYIYVDIHSHQLAHFLLSELYLPADTDPTKPAFPKHHSNATTTSSGGDHAPSPTKKAASIEEDDDTDSDEFSVDVHTLCHPGIQNTILHWIFVDIGIVLTSLYSYLIVNGRQNWQGIMI